MALSGIINFKAKSKPSCIAKVAEFLYRRKNVPTKLADIIQHVQEKFPERDKARIALSVKIRLLQLVKEKKAFESPYRAHYRLSPTQYRFMLEF